MKISFDYTKPDHPEFVEGSGRTGGKSYMFYVATLSLLLIFSSNILNAVVVGSNTAVSREALTTFPAADGDNEMCGFASFENGFKLENSAASCIFNSFFPIGGSMTLNDGTLNLSRDLIFNADFKVAGTINAQNYAFKFTTTQPITLPSSEISSGTTLNYLDTVILSRAVNSVDWSYDNAYVAVVVNLDFSGSEIFVYSFDGTSLTLKDSKDLGGHGYSVRWHPSDYYLAVGCSFLGDEVQVYEFDTGSETLTKTDGEILELGVYAVAWDPSGDYVAVLSQGFPITAMKRAPGNDDKLYIYSVTNGILSLVTNVSPGSVTFSKNALDWSPTGDYIAIGIQKNDSVSELIVYYFNGSTLSLNAQENIAESVDGLSWRSLGNYIAVGLGGGSERLRIYEHDSGGGTLTEQTSARIGESLSVLEADWSPDGNYLAMSRAVGTGTEFRVYSFDSGAVSLTLEHEVDMVDSVNDVRWSPNGFYIAIGDKNQELNVYSFGTGVGGEGDRVVFKDIKLAFNSDITLAKNLEFQGACALKGNGHALNLDGPNNIIVTGGASLLLEGLTLKNVSGNNIRCYDNLSTVSLRDITWLQEADYTFTVGRIDVVGDVTVTGTHTFTYQSGATSTIFSRAKLMFGSGMTFKYDSPTTDRDLLTMADKTAVLHLYETTLQSTSTGLQLTKGTLVVEGTCPVKSEATVEFEGITFGDGVSVSNDLTYKPLPESGLDVKSGWLVYKNVNG